jgi:hypothetical protein
MMDRQIEQERQRRMRPMRIEEIGGGRVVRTFKLADRNVMAGESIDVATLSRMPIANRNALIENGSIAVWPKGDGAPTITARPAAAAKPAEGTQRFMINKGFGKFAVIEGRVLNEAPLDKAAAEALVAEGQQAKH